MSNVQKKIHYPEARERLLLSGLRIFATRGYDGATVREISDGSGSNIAAINYYFRNKQGFFEAVKQYARDLFRNAISRTWELSQTDPEAALRYHIEALLDTTYNSVMFYVNWLFLRELIDTDTQPPPSDPETERRRLEYEEHMFKLLKQLLGEKAASDRNVRLLRFTFHSLCQFLPIQTAAETKYLAGGGAFNLMNDIDKTTLADFIMNTVRRTIDDMRRQAGEPRN